MNKIPSLILIVAGVALMIAGLSAADSISSDLARFFAGSAFARSVWLLLGGLASATVGFIGFFRRVKSA
ncbi:MAG TPA: DUF3185 family protein [Opitutaceae bacterium]|nr:DUF3185 family protein [Opitutaceae bacterium]